LIKRLRKFLPRNSLLTIYKAYVRPHLDYKDIIHDYPGNITYSQKIESIQYNACLAITGCIHETSREKLYSELGVESLPDRLFISIKLSKVFYLFLVIYLSDYIQPPNRAFVGLRARPVLQPLRTDRYRGSFFLFCIFEWNKLDCRIHKISPQFLQSWTKITRQP